MFSFYFIDGKINQLKYKNSKSVHLDLFVPGVFGECFHSENPTIQLYFNLALSKIKNKKRNDKWKKINTDDCLFYRNTHNPDSDVDLLFICLVDRAQDVSIILSNDENFMENYSFGVNEKQIEKIIKIDACDIQEYESKTIKEVLPVEPEAQESVDCESSGDVSFKSTVTKEELSEMLLKCKTKECLHMQKLIQKIIDKEKDESIKSKLVTVRDTLDENNYLTVSEASTVIWRLIKNEIEHDLSDLDIRPAKHKDVFPFADIKQWQFDQIFPYLNKKDQKNYGHLRSEFAKTMFSFLQN